MLRREYEKLMVKIIDQNKIIFPLTLSLFPLTSLHKLICFLGVNNKLIPLSSFGLKAANQKIDSLIV
jgi:uncharacterized protein YjfI (DUF2170 family)